MTSSSTAASIREDKSLGNRQRFLRRARARGQARRSTRRSPKRSASPTSARAAQGLDLRPRARRAALPSRSRDSGERDFVLPGNKEFVAGDQIEKPKGGGGRRSRPGRHRIRRAARIDFASR